MNKFVTINAGDLQLGDMIVLGRPGAYRRIIQFKLLAVNNNIIHFKIENDICHYERETNESVNILPRHLLVLK